MILSNELTLKGGISRARHVVLYRRLHRDVSCSTFSRLDEADYGA